MNRAAVSSLEPAQKSKGFIKGVERYAQTNAIVLSPPEGLYREESFPDGILGGRTVAVKDNIAVKGWRTTCASGILDDYESPYHATVVEKVLAQGGVIMGKTNHDEFAMGSSTEHSRFGPAKHHIDNERVPGGSSGGSALSVALGLTDLALARIPAVLCGNRPHSVECTVSNRPTAGCRGTDWWRLPPHLIRSVPSPKLLMGLRFFWKRRRNR